MSKKSLAERELINALEGLTEQVKKSPGVQYPLSYLEGWFSQNPKFHELHKALFEAKTAVFNAERAA